MMDATVRRYEYNGKDSWSDFIGRTFVEEDDYVALENEKKKLEVRMQALLDLDLELRSKIAVYQHTIEDIQELIDGAY